MGEGRDESEPNKKSVYDIRLEWDSSQDDINVRYDTGNKSLRDGILWKVLGVLGEAYKS